MADRLKGKIALITGAAQGLGAAMAEAFVAEGARVLMTDVNEAKVEAEAARHGAAASWLKHDVTSQADWSAAVEAAKTRYGGLHILVNNAGIGLYGSIEDASFESWRLTHAVDLDSVFLGCQTALPLMAETTRDSQGSILNVSSIAGIIASDAMCAYNSAKAAVRHLSKSVALHCCKRGYHINCNSIHPVFIDTPIIDPMAGRNTREELVGKLARQIPIGRIGKPHEVAMAAVYLCSDEAAFVTGAELAIDGGISAM